MKAVSWHNIKTNDNSRLH